jgi:very-short-patch-repair endonuclease
MKNDRIHTRKIFFERRRELRRLTPQEKILWSCLKKSGIGFKFQRQHSIGPYIVDFYCPQKRLIIEIDGSQHLENKEYDDERTNYLEMLGYRVLRFWNNDITANLSGVLMHIQECLTTERRRD